MKRHFAAWVAALCLCASALSTALAVGVAPAKLIAEPEAQAVGLTRAWFGQVALDKGFQKVTSATIQDGVLLITTDAGVLQAFDAETGAVMWIVAVGDGWLLPPAINSKIVAALCGDELVVYDRFTGDKIDSTQLYGQPSSAPALSEREIYVPTFGEKIFSYAIRPSETSRKTVDATIDSMLADTRDLKAVAPVMQEKLEEYRTANAPRFSIVPLDEIRPRSTAAFGTTMVAPVVGTQSYELDVVGWTTDQGWLMIGGMMRNEGDDPFKLLYKLQARPNFSYVNERRLGNRALIPRVDVDAAPCFVPVDRSIQNLALPKERQKGGMFVTGSRSGHVFALNDATGQLRWTYLTETAVSERISAVNDRAFIPTASGDFFAVSLENGKELWKARHVRQFVAASATRIFVADELDRLAALSMETGARLKTLDVGNSPIKVFNMETDRIYLVSEDGLVQCLRETQQVEPIQRRESCESIFRRVVPTAMIPTSAAPSGGRNGASGGGATFDEEDEVEVDLGADANDAAQTGAGQSSASQNAATDEEEEEDDPFADGDEEEVDLGGDSDDGSDSDSDDSGNFEEEDPFGGDEEEDPFA